MGLVILHYVGGTSPLAPEVHILAAVPFLIYAAFATSLSIKFAKTADASRFEYQVADANAKTEKDRGLAFGLAMLVAGVLA